MILQGGRTFQVCEFVLERARHVDAAGTQHLMHRTIASGEVSDEALHNFWRESEAEEHTMHIEKVARMVSIHRRHQLAPVEFRHSKRGQGEHGREQVADGPYQRPGFDEKQRSPEDEVDFNLHLHTPAAREYLGLIARFAARNFGPDSAALETALDRRQFCRALGEGDIPSDQVRGEDGIDIDREARHVLHEQIQCRASLHREAVRGKDIGHDLKHQANGSYIGFVHHGLRMSEQNSTRWSLRVEIEDSLFVSLVTKCDHYAESSPILKWTAVYHNLQSSPGLIQWVPRRGEFR